MYLGLIILLTRQRGGFLFTAFCNTNVESKGTGVYPSRIRLSQIFMSLLSCFQAYAFGRLAGRSFPVAEGGADISV